MYRSFHSFRVSKGVTAVIGSGGKTSFLRFMASRLDGSVILTTSTKIFPFPDIPLVTVGQQPDLENPSITDKTEHPDSSLAAESDSGSSIQPGLISPTGSCFDSSAKSDIVSASGPADVSGLISDALKKNRIICLGHPFPGGKLSSPVEQIPFEALSALADYVLVEADGAAGLPLKAHRAWEPVIPACSSLTVCLVGASGIGYPAGKVCHCPKRFASLAGSSIHEPVTAEHIARVLKQENLADCYLVNQVDTLSDAADASRLCNMIHKPAYPVSLLCDDH